MNSDESLIRNLVAQWHLATAEGDVDAILDLMSEDAIFLVAGKPAINGRGEFAQNLRGLLQTHRITSTGDIQDMKISGELAYCLTLLTVQVTPRNGGETQTRSGNTLSIFQRQGEGGWRLIRDANLLTG